MNAGGVAGVVIGVLALVAALLGSLGFLIFKQHRKTQHLKAVVKEQRMVLYILQLSKKRKETLLFSFLSRSQ